jgi:hypothetical protein
VCDTCARCGVLLMRTCVLQPLFGDLIPAGSAGGDDDGGVGVDSNSSSVGNYAALGAVAAPSVVASTP